MTDDPLDARLRLVADGQRRQIIRRLRGAPEGKVTIDHLADHLAGEPSADGQPADRDRTSVRLVHTDLPKLADFGVLTVDGDVVRYRGDERIEIILDALPADASVVNA